MVAFSRFIAIIGHDREIIQTFSTSLIFAVADNISILVNVTVM
jgi:hypothetical protein